METGRFTEETVAVQVPQRKGTVEVNKDEYPKPDTTLDGLQGLRSVFIKDSSGTVTAGNASGINDGAAAVVLASETTAQKLGAKPLARIVSYAQAGVDPAIMGMGPVPAVLEAVRKIIICVIIKRALLILFCFLQCKLKRANWQLDDVDNFELNEAFAAQSLAVVKSLGADPAKVNVNGGAIALGHPIGASGARVVVTLINVLKQTGGKKGVAALCVGGGMGIAICLELL